MQYPDEVVSVEHCLQLRERQMHLYDERGHTVRMVSSLEQLEPAEDCIYYSNELPDAFPVPCFHWKEGAFYERGVGIEGEGFCWLDRDAPMSSPPAIAPELIAAWPDDYISEYNPAVADWQAEIARIMPRGLAITVDYGYSQQEYYRQQRTTGTLMAHVAQQASEDVLSDPGNRDITAHVDFTTLVRAGRDVGFEPLLWMSQVGWLAQSPSGTELVQSLATQNVSVRVQRSARASRRARRRA